MYVCICFFELCSHTQSSATPQSGGKPGAITACSDAVAGSSAGAGSTTRSGPTDASSAAGEGVSLEDPVTAV